MRFFTCPVCGGAFTEDAHTLCCPNHHAFDLARAGYVNLLRSQKSSDARHGDDKAMVAARRRFLDAGFYDPLAERLLSLATEALTRRGERAPVCLDAGCGEGFYTARLRAALADARFSPHVAGMDISKDALIAAARRDPALELAVGSIFSIPAAARSADFLLNLFAPYVPSEFHRILKDGGLLLRAFPAERHLFELKEAIYEHPYENEIDTLAMAGFSLLHEETLSFPLALSRREDIQSLFCMTPYCYKTGTESRAKLDSLSSLEVGARFIIALYRKEPD